MKNEHVLVLFVGRTGSGKSSLIAKLCEKYGFRQLISNTTRPKRGDNDNDHVFVTVDDYKKAKESGNIAAETEINGNYYYATVEQLYEADFYTIDPFGKNELLKRDLPGIRFVTIYVSCPDDIREKRAVGKRGDNKQTYRARDFSERSQFRRFVADEEWDYSIKNMSFPKALSVIKWICDVEKVWKNHLEEE